MDTCTCGGATWRWRSTNTGWVRRCTTCLAPAPTGMDVWVSDTARWDRQPEDARYERWGEENDTPAIAIIAADYLYSRLGSGTIWAEQVRRLVESLEPWQRVELARTTRGDAACPSFEAASAEKVEA